jgi:ribosome maturation factor RimP
MTEASQALTSVIEPILESLGLHLYDVELTGATGRARTLQVLVQRADGGPVDLEAITDATRALSPVLDADAAASRILRAAYTLEVSSPGLERPLRRAEHWRGLEGEVVSIKTRVDGATVRLRGSVTAVDDEGVDVDVDGTARRDDFADMTQARTVFEWGAAEKVKQS